MDASGAGPDATAAGLVASYVAAQLGVIQRLPERFADAEADDPIPDACAAMVRLRSALRAYGGVCQAGRTSHVRAELRELGEFLTEIRENDAVHDLLDRPATQWMAKGSGNWSYLIDVLEPLERESASLRRQIIEGRDDEFTELAANLLTDLVFTEDAGERAIAVLPALRAEAAEKGLRATELALVASAGYPQWKEARKGADEARCATELLCAGLPELGERHDAWGNLSASVGLVHDITNALRELDELELDAATDGAPEAFAALRRYLAEGLAHAVPWVRNNLTGVIAAEDAGR